MVYAASLSGPFVFLFMGMYYSYKIIQCSTIYVVKLSYVRFLWSVYLVIRCPNIMVRNYFRVSTIIDSSRSVVV